MIKLTGKHRDIVNQFIITHWGDERIVINGKMIIPSQENGFLIFNSIEIIGLITYRKKDSRYEILTLNSLIENQGVGSALLETLINVASERHVNTITVVTTNDNTRALRFYQKHGFVISDFRINELRHSRTLKPSIPLLGNDSIPIRDEIELIYKGRGLKT